LKKWLKKIAVVFSVIFLGFFVWNHFDSRAIPKTVDAVRSVIGDQAVLKMEETFYGAKNTLSRIAFNAEVKSGVTKQEEMTQLSAPPIEASFISSLVPIAMINSPRKDSENVGKWIDKGVYAKTSGYFQKGTNNLADIAVFDPGKIELHLVCGTADPAPGGSGKIPKDDLEKAIAAFSGGFQHKHYPSGIIVDGKLLKSMRKDAGTIVVFKDGKIRVGKWGRDFVKVTPEMKDARQCLYLVDKGKCVAEKWYDCFALKNDVSVNRSGIGLDKDGRLIYAAGKEYTFQGLANALIAAGAVQAMCLDMNYSNYTCGVFSREEGKIKIYPLTSRFCDPSRFLATNSRDFFYITKKE